MRIQLGALIFILVSMTGCVILRAHHHEFSLQEKPMLHVAHRFTPTPFPFENKKYLAYELELINNHNEPIEIEKLIVSDEVSHEIMASYNIKTLEMSFFDSNNTSISANALSKGIKGLIFIWVEFSDDVVLPLVLENKLIGRVGSKSFSKKGPRVLVPDAKPVVLGAPFKESARWFAANGPSASSSHRKAVPPIPGPLFLAQRFAIDWIYVNKQGHSFKNNGASNEDWYGYGKELIAVADGMVTEIRDEIPENKPGSRAVKIDVKTVLGNSVSLLIGDNQLAVYAHLIPGSLKVKAGDKVKKGQLLGKLGNSGNSDAPHLHFHLVNGKDPLFSEGQSYVLDSFEMLGKNESIFSVMSGGDVFSPLVFTPGRCMLKDNFMLENVVIKLPKGINSY